MKKYATYYFMENGERLRDRFDNLVENSNYDIDNFYHPTLDGCYRANKDKLQAVGKDCCSIIYEVDTDCTPHKYRMVAKEELIGAGKIPLEETALQQQLKELSETMKHIAQQMIYLEDDEITHHAYQLIGAGDIALEWSEVIEKHIADKAFIKQTHGD